MGSCLVIGTGADTLEARSSAGRQVRLRQLMSQDVADDISTDVYHSLPCPNHVVVECVAIICQRRTMTNGIQKQHVSQHSSTNDHTLHAHTPCVHVHLYSHAAQRCTNDPAHPPDVYVCACVFEWECASMRSCVYVFLCVSV